MYRQHHVRSCLVGAALEWACLLNLSLMCVHWGPEVLSAPAGKEVCAAVCVYDSERCFNTFVSLQFTSLAALRCHGALC